MRKWAFFQQVYNNVVDSINYVGEEVVVASQNGTFTADKVIVTVPLKMLQEGNITFTPSRDSNKLNAINNATVWDGMKVFFWIFF